MPFLAEDLWQTLVRDVCPGRPDSVHLAGWPVVRPALVDDALVAGVADAQTVIRLGRSARAQSGPPASKLRQPLAEAVVAAPADRRAGLEANAALIASELNVRRVRVVEDRGEVVDIRIVPNFRAVGPRLGAAVPTVKAALERGDYSVCDGMVAVAGHTLEPGDYEERVTSRDGLAASHEGVFAVGVDPRITPELRDEGAARDLVHRLQELRKERGFDVSDRIRVRWTGNDAAARVLAAHSATIAAEVLAVEIERADDVDGSPVTLADVVVALDVDTV